MLHLLEERTLIKGTPLIDRERDSEKERKKEKKAQHPEGFKPTTSLSCGACSTAVLQPLPGARLVADKIALVEPLKAFTGLTS